MNLKNFMEKLIFLFFLQKFMTKTTSSFQMGRHVELCLLLVYFPNNSLNSVTELYSKSEKLKNENKFNPTN